MPDFGIYAGDTDKTIYVRLRDSSTGLAKTGLAYNSAGAVCSYTLPLAARAAITLATQTVTGAHSDGGFVEIDATNCKGLYRLDLPDAAIASGSYTIISIEFDGIIEESIEIPLHLPKANVTQFGGSAGTFASGRPEVNASHWAGTATTLSATTAKPQVDVDSIDDDATAANNAEAFFDGTGYAGTNNVIPLVTTLSGHSPQTGDTYAVATGANGFSAIKTDTGNLVTRITSTLFSGITSLAEWLGLLAGKQTGDATALTEIKASGAGSGTFDPTTDSLEAIKDLGDVNWVTGAGGTGLTALASGTAQAGGTSTQIILASASSFADNVLNGNVVNLLTGTGAGQSRVITANVLTGDICTVYPAWTTNPDATTTYEIVQGSANVSTISLDGTAADNLELDYDGTGYDKANSTIGTTTTNTDMRGTDGANTTVPDAAGTAPTAAEIKTAIEAGGSSIDQILTLAVAIDALTKAAGSGDLAAMKTIIDALPDSGALTSLAQAATVALDATVAKEATLAVVATDTTTDIPATITTLQTDVTQIKGDLPAKLTKNTAFTNFMFKMVDITDGVTAETGLTPTCERSLDGAAFAACANSPTEVSGGWYKIDLAAGDLNGNSVVLKFTDATSRATEFLVITQAT